MHVTGDHKWTMTDRAVVVVLLLGRSVREFHALSRTEESRNYVLMFVVWKFDRELQSRCWISKCVARFVTRASLCMTHGTDRRPCPFEKLRPVTTNTRRVVGIIDDVGKLRNCRPLFCGNDVAGLAFRLMLFGCVRKLRVIDLSNTDNRKIGRASCRERVKIWVVGG